MRIPSPKPQARGGTERVECLHLPASVQKKKETQASRSREPAGPLTTVPRPLLGVCMLPLLENSRTQGMWLRARAVGRGWPQCRQRLRALSSLKASVSAALRFSKCSVNHRLGDDDELTERPLLQRTGISSAHTGARVWHQLPLVDRARAAGAAPGLAPRSAAPQLARTGCLLRDPPDNPGAKKEAAQEEGAVKPNKCRERQVPVP